MLGIDVSKDNLVCALVQSGTHKTVWRDSYPNTVSGVNQLLRRLNATTSLVVEPTGRYSDLVVRLATEKGKTVLLAPPRRAKSFLESIQSRAKTDPLDGRGLGMFALSQPLRLFQPKSTAVEQVEQLLSARKGLSRTLAALEMQHKELPHAAARLEPVIAAIKEQKAALDKQIATLTQGNRSVPALPEFAIARSLDAVPGIGPVVAAAVAARLNSKQFAHPDAFVAYIGLDVTVRQSGKRSGQRGLTKQGDAELRRLLYLSAQANLRCKDPNNPFKRQYQRELDKGMKTTAALCAVARKLAKLCWSLHRYGTTYDAQRVLEQPTRAKKVLPEELAPREGATSTHDLANLD